MIQESTGALAICDNIYGYVYTYRGNPGKTGYMSNIGNRYMQRIVLPQSVFSFPTSVAVSADYYTHQLLCNSSRGLKQSLVILSFDPLLNCVFF